MSGTRDSADANMATISTPTQERRRAAASPAPLCTPEGAPVAVVHLVAELAPYARTGGLGEAVASLAKYQAARGIDTTIVMPLYREVSQKRPNLRPVGDAFTVMVGGRTEEARFFEERPEETPEVVADHEAAAHDGNGRAPATTEPRPAGSGGRTPRVLFIANPHYFDRGGIYGEQGRDYGDNLRRYGFFCMAAVAGLPRVVQGPVILHAHDWHTALAPTYLRTYFQQHDFYRRVRTILTVHNAAFQGYWSPDGIGEVGLPPALFNWRQLEWHGQLNVLKGGLAFADAVTTVSPTHAHELRTAAGGFGLHGAFIALRDRFVGIVNGIDQQVWDPRRDPHIAVRYSRENLSGKQACKAALQKTFGLPQNPRVPIFAMTARITSQKGFDLILGDPGYFALDAQFIFLGAGERRYERLLAALADRAPTRISVEFNFTEVLEHQLMAGADMCLMPSQYEPCGLTQMRAQRYGTIPIARRTGGLADTIEDGVTGFLFDDYTAQDFMDAAVRAVDHYGDRAAWDAMMRDAMARDFGWERSEARYLEVYRKVLGAQGRRSA